MDNQLNRLEKRIIKEIKGAPNERITFYRFMQLALYDAEDGYYTRQRDKIGKTADFYTSSSVNPVFAKTLLNSFLEMFSQLGYKEQLNFLEIGGGDGKFAKDLLDELQSAHPTTYKNFRYYLLEASKYHEQLQNERLTEHQEQVRLIGSLDELPKNFQGIIFANELVDAFPVHRVLKRTDELREICVTWDEGNSKFVEITGPLSDIRLVDYFYSFEIELREGQRAEVNLDVIDWLESLAGVLASGYLVLIDYGHLAEVLYDTSRHDGSLMCYYQHQSNDNPYRLVGEQDITTHVNFSAIINEAAKLGMEQIYYNFQSNFLMSSGILDFFSENTGQGNNGSEQEQQLKTNRAIRQLITPGEMGEVFKVIIFNKGIEKATYKFQKNIWD